MLRRLIIMSCLLLPFSLFAETFVAGKDYEIISSREEPQAVSGPVKVTEFFSYGCPWCYRIEPTLTQWARQQGDAIQFSRRPVIFNKDWVYYAKAYYAAHLLRQEDRLNPLLFKTIQEKKIPLATNEAMIDFFTQQGIDKETAESAFKNSTIVEMNITQGAALMSRFHVNAVPAFVINERFKTDLQMAKGEERLFKVLAFLVNEAKKKS